MGGPHAMPLHVSMRAGTPLQQPLSKSSSKAAAVHQGMCGPGPVNMEPELRKRIKELEQLLSCEKTKSQNYCATVRTLQDRIRELELEQDRLVSKLSAQAEQLAEGERKIAAAEAKVVQAERERQEAEAREAAMAEKITEMQLVLDNERTRYAELQETVQQMQMQIDEQALSIKRLESMEALQRCAALQSLKRVFQRLLKGAAGIAVSDWLHNVRTSRLQAPVVPQIIEEGEKMKALRQAMSDCLRMLDRAHVEMQDYRHQSFAQQLPRVYQVHALEPYLKKLVDDVCGGWDHVHAKAGVLLRQTI